MLEPLVMPHVGLEQSCQMRLTYDQFARVST
jgi:hypothetical protein